MSTRFHIIPDDRPVLPEIARKIGQSRFDLARTGIVLPSARALEVFRQRHLSETEGVPSLGPYLFTQDDFLSRCLLPPRNPFPGPVQRREILRLAMSDAHKRLAPLFRDASKDFLADFFSFSAIGDRLLRFFDELQVEGVGFDALRRESVYTDFEKHVSVLEDVWHAYLDGLDREGFDDRSAWKSKAAVHPDFVDRYEYVAVGISGFPPQCEIATLKAISSRVPMEFYLGASTAASPQLRRLFESFDEIPPPGTLEGPEPEPRFVVAGCPDAITQAGFVARAIADCRRLGISDGRIAIVLPDERAIDPLTAVLGRTSLNIAMGFPLSASPYYGLLLSLQALVRNRTGDGYAGKNLTEFAHHLLIKNMGGRDGRLRDEIPRLLDKVRRQRLLRIPENALTDTPVLLDEIRQAESFVNQCIALGDAAAGAIDYLTDLEKRWPDEFRRSIGLDRDMRSGRERLLQHLSELASGWMTDRISGPPAGAKGPALDALLAVLEGARFPAVNREGTLPVLGLLETRTLDFDAVIIADMNEGLLPGKSPKDLFLNTALREALGLPTPEDREALYGVYLKQLFGNARHAFLSWVDDPQRGVRSRFLEQVLLRFPNLPEISGRERLRDWVLSGKGAATAPPEAVEKDDSVRSRLAEMRFSATALETYLACPYRFYLEDVCRIRVPDWPDDRPPAWLKGRIFHDAVRSLYAEPSDDLFRDPARHHHAFMERLREAAARHDLARLVPSTRLSLENWGQRLAAFSEQEVALHQEGWRIMDTEQEVVAEHPGGYRLKGIIDRRDRHDGRIRIIDYKTGARRKKKKEYLLSAGSATFTAVQLPLYLYLTVRAGHGEAANMEGLYEYDLKESFLPEKMHADFPGVDPRQYIESFEVWLGELLKTIHDPGRPFGHTTDRKNCRYCPYDLMCRIADLKETA